MSKVDNIKQKIQEADQKFKRVRLLYKKDYIFKFIFSPREWKYQFFTYTEVKMTFPLEQRGFHLSMSPLKTIEYKNCRHENPRYKILDLWGEIGTKLLFLALNMYVIIVFY